MAIRNNYFIPFPFVCMKNNYLKIFFLTAFLSVSFFLNSCTKVTTATVLIPTLNTINAIIDVTSTTAQSGRHNFPTKATG